MHLLLKFAGGYNIVAGISMILFYHEGFRLLGIPKPEFSLPIQLVGLLVALFGVGYLMVERAPVENRNILLLGFLSKLLGPMMAVGYILQGDLPMSMIPVLFLADTIYLMPFWMIYRKASELSRRPEHFEVLGHLGNSTDGSSSQSPTRNAA